MSIPNKISVSGSSSHMVKVWENLKLAMPRCKVALPSEDIANPSAVFRFTAAGTIWPYSGLQSCCGFLCGLVRELLQGQLWL